MKPIKTEDLKLVSGGCPGGHVPIGPIVVKVVKHIIREILD